jgi:hypothetical protein
VARRNYINNKEFYADIVAYHKLVDQADKEGIDRPQIPNAIGTKILLICMRLSDSYNFINYTYKDEMISDAIENCVAAVLKFDYKRFNNPHAFFTTCAWNAFVRRIGKEQKQQVIKHLNMEHMSLDMEEMSMGHGGTNGRAPNERVSEGLRHHYEVIEKFEERMNKKKKAQDVKAASKPQTRKKKLTSKPRKVKKKPRK